MIKKSTGLTRKRKYRKSINTTNILNNSIKKKVRLIISEHLKDQKRNQRIINPKKEVTQNKLTITVRNRSITVSINRVNMMPREIRLNNHRLMFPKLGRLCTMEGRIQQNIRDL